ncbi:uncharacterized protein C8Q71DRAFT_66900 [Rhodofomes roseus]|uniref:Uncharacterized protein n=1 Tax=Rhodofomes roseus TaxID=34475 RepID=A0ABQ8KEE8_9APHY|nr:uncharacterized protein C8Q71DRAFT_66900 [Rhodofomes roseus]KAH9836114.1 hypothetical protein C8Q71DRAFT_66900 [Rhodofomes roseus]
MHVKEFAEHVRTSSLRDTLRIISFALYQSIATEELIVQQTGGNLGHRFVMVTIELNQEGSPDHFRTYARVEFWGKDAFEEHPVSQVVMLSDDSSVFMREARELGHLYPGASPSGWPTLGEFASLLEVIHSRTPNFNAFVRNCYWYSETIMFCLARRHADAWLAGDVWPESLAQWIKRECDAPACIAGMVFENPVARWGAAVGVGWFRWSMATFPNLVPENERVTYHEVDIEQSLDMWKAATL